ncbi:hypothetical protein [Halovenus salina]|uniref:DUF378 domain-containing protein n=1 Tax=Halovenus salina TaxID=1510225 RepID=A0ABD5VYB8_9EURY|nr:hypothetical protein [Halovenus salina]
MERFGDVTTRIVLEIIAAIAALNWAAVEFADTDILVDTLSLTGDTYTAVIAVIGAAGALSLYNGAAYFLADNSDN